MKITLQLTGFLLVATIAIILLAFAFCTTQRHLNILQRDFGAVQSESFHLAEHVGAQLARIDNSAKHLEATRNPAISNEFRDHVVALNAWIATNRCYVATTGQVAAFGEIATAVDSYITGLNTNFKGPEVESGTASQSVLQADTARKRVVKAAEGLRQAEQKALEELMREARTSLAVLQRHFLGAILLVTVLGAVLLRLMYVACIAPLNAELAENRCLLQRQEKLASLGTLAASVAHEIRNPLTAVKARLHGLKRTIQPNSSASEDLSIIHEQINRLDNYVKDFLKFARPAAPRLRTVKVRNLFDKVFELLYQQLSKTGIILSIDCQADLSVHADSNQILQVLINLVQNAAESITGAGSITLRGRRIANPSNGHTAALEVIDTGKGISSEVQRRLFDPFFSTKEGGTGLGLSIAACIVEKHGGLLKYRTKPGSTTFSVALPS